MKKDNSTLNFTLATILLITSIIVLFFVLGTYILLLLVPMLSVIKTAAFSRGDYTFWTIAWTLLYSYMIILSIEWIRGKPVKNSMINTLTLILVMGIWGIIRTSNISILGIITFVFYGPILYYFYKTKKEKLST